ncbi:VOC family protein [Specibacter sp. RAF43]|uniref:VOC family protein n=1 Tax=Specibacter sp. RAF43 TaxID=3233057 RepID=UPI003F9A54D9
MVRYDALVSADVVTDSPDVVAGHLVDLFGLPAPRASAFHEPEGHGFRAIWLRAHPSLKVSPTRIEVIAPRPRTEPHDYVQERIAAQGDRLVRTHATVLAGDIDEVLEHLRRNKVRHRVTAPGPELDFPRVWVGVTAEDPLGYDAEVDAGLLLEVVPTSHSGLPLDFASVAGTSAAPGEIVRVSSRRFLVADLDTSLSALEDNLGLEPSAITHAPDGRSARIRFSIGTSADIELVQPSTADSRLGRYLARWGTGPHAIVLEVRGLEEFADGAQERGIHLNRIENGDGSSRLATRARETCGVPFEFVEAPN